ncbi:MAG: UxaA family hydrolase [Verrucomicrobiae bacterium]|nr:UxaA family hydrolase [Verrucomicrobiae bacterium]
MKRPVYLRLHSQDNVVVLLRDVKAGELIEIEGQHIVVRANIPLGHKIAARPISAGEQIMKYGVSIGVATRAVTVGEHVHVHNMKSNYVFG